jgi:hypothetical protein
MKNFFLFSFIIQIIAGSVSFAQPSLQDVIHLKDGSIFRGTIIEQYPDSLVKVEITGGNLIVVTSAQLNYIEYKMKPGRKASVQEDRDGAKPLKRRGYFNITEMGLMPGTNSNYYYNYDPSTSGGFTLQTINGYRFNSHWTAGGGLGLDIIQQPLVQVFADARWEILDKKSSPFIFADAGYGFPISSSPKNTYTEITYKGGVSWGTGIGMRIRFRNDGAFIVSAGYKMVKRSEEIKASWEPFFTKNDYTFNRLAIRFGLAF